MTMLRTAPVTVWCEGGVPYGIVWNGRHYRVTDTPTRLEDEMGVLTHPLNLTGWRFQGTDDDEVLRMFDIVRDGTEWHVIRTFS